MNYSSAFRLREIWQAIKQVVVIGLVFTVLLALGQWIFYGHVNWR